MVSHYKFSILVPAYNEEQSIHSCLKSLIAIPDKKEIIVIDDASTDRTIQIVEGFSDKGVILVRRKKNGGRAAALNSGLQSSTGDIVVTTDADTVVPPGWLQRFTVCFQPEGVAAVGGAYQASNKDKPLANAMSILDQILNRLLRKFIIPNKLSGVNSAIYRNVLLSLNGFNENSWWSEDSELGWKLKSIGRVVYDPHNMVSTTYPSTWTDIWKRKFCWGYAMGLKFKEQVPFTVKLWLRPILFLTLFISLIVLLTTIPFGFNAYLIPGVIFSLLLSTLTILYIPLGMVVIIRNKDYESFKTLPLLAILPMVREFAYIYGMCLGFCKGCTGAIKPTWKEC